MNKTTRYIDVLQKLAYNYNSYHSTINLHQMKQFNINKRY